MAAPEDMAPEEMALIEPNIFVGTFSKPNASTGAAQFKIRNKISNFVPYLRFTADATTDDVLEAVSNITGTRAIGVYMKDESAKPDRVTGNLHGISGTLLQSMTGKDMYVAVSYDRSLTAYAAGGRKRRRRSRSRRSRSRRSRSRRSRYN